MINFYFGLLIFAALTSITIIEHTYGWKNISITLLPESFYLASYYILANNIMFSTGIIIAQKIKISTINFVSINYLKVILLPSFIIGSVLHIKAFDGLDYQDYVEFNGSDWGRVLMNFGSPIILVYLYQKKYKIVTFLLAPYMYMTIILGVRSYLLFSLAPIMIYIFLSEKNMKLSKILIYGFYALLTGLIGELILSYRSGNGGELGLVLPEQSLIEMFIVLFNQFQNESIANESNTILLMLNYILLPFTKIFGNFTSGFDNPIFIANIMDGNDNFGGKFQHYPSTWYGETLVSYGYYGVIMASYFGFIIGFFSKLFSNEILKIVLLPSSIWITYMILRGAPVIAFANTAYPLWMYIITLIIPIILLRSK